MYVHMCITLVYEYAYYSIYRCMETEASGCMFFCVQVCIRNISAVYTCAYIKIHVQRGGPYAVSAANTCMYTNTDVRKHTKRRHESAGTSVTILTQKCRYVCDDFDTKVPVRL